jgi:UDP-galactopyranose mutase
VSTPIRDVVSPYGVAELALIGMTGEDFVNAVESLLTRSSGDERRWLKRVDGFLSTMSWERTFERMSVLIARSIDGDAKEARPEPAAPAHARRTVPAASHFDVAMEA